MLPQKVTRNQLLEGVLRAADRSKGLPSPSAKPFEAFRRFKGGSEEGRHFAVACRSLGRATGRSKGTFGAIERQEIVSKPIKFNGIQLISSSFEAKSPRKRRPNNDSYASFHLIRRASLQPHRKSDRLRGEGRRHAAPLLRGHRALPREPRRLRRRDSEGAKSLFTAAAWPLAPVPPQKTEGFRLKELRARPLAEAAVHGVLTGLFCCRTVWRLRRGIFDAALLLFDGYVGVGRFMSMKWG